MSRPRVKQPARWIAATIAGLAVSAALGFVFGRLWLLREEARAPEEAPVQEAPAPAASFRRRPVEVEVKHEPPKSVVHGDSRFADLNNRAIELLNEGDLDRAIELFETCQAGEPDEPVFRRNLAEALARGALRDYELERPCGRCLESLERALELAPHRDDIQKLLEHWTKEMELERDYWRESSLHFDLAYDGEKRELVWGSGRILNELEDAYRDLCDHFSAAPVEDGRTRISVVLYPREGFHSITGLGEWAGGAFDGTVRVPVGDFTKEERGLERVLRHELVHAFVRECGGPSVPGWLNEGLAQWLEPGADQAARQAREKLAAEEYFPLERLQGTLSTWTDQDEIVRAYAQSLVMVQYIAGEYGEAVVFDMVRGCKAGVGPEVTFERVVRLPLGTVVEDLTSVARGRGGR